MPNLSDLVRRGFTPGEHTVHVKSIERTASKTKQTPQLQFTAEDENGTTGMWWRTLSVKGLGFIAEDMLAVGEQLELSDDRGNWPNEIADFAEQVFGDADLNIEVTQRADDPERTEVKVIGRA